MNNFTERINMIAFLNSILYFSICVSSQESQKYFFLKLHIRHLHYHCHSHKIKMKKLAGTTET